MDKKMWKKAALGAGAGGIGMLSTTALMAWMIGEELIGQAHLDLVSALCLIVGGMIPGFAAGGGKNRWTVGFAAVAGVVAGLLAVNLVLFDGVLKSAPVCVALLMGSAAAAMLLTGGKKGKSKRNYQYKNYRTG